MPAKHPSTEIWRSDAPFRLEHGDCLPGLEIAYETWGSPSATPDNVLVVLHALSGSSHAFASTENPEPGWWEGLLGSHSPIDPRRFHVICANLVGGCYGSTGPRSVDPRSGKRFGLTFPQISLRDIIEAHRMFLKGIGVNMPVSLIGGSMGGMLVLKWSVDHPDEVRDAIAIATPARSDAFAIALRSVQRDAILGDAHFRNGEYDDSGFPSKGLALARKIGMITYRTPAEFNDRFGRDARDPRPHFNDGLFEVQSYLNYQGKKFVDRFDPSTYLYFSRAMDLFDLAEGHDSLDDAVARVSARFLLLAMDSDLLVPLHHMKEIEMSMQRGGIDVHLEKVRTTKGHDGFLTEQKQILGFIDTFLERCEQPDENSG